MELGRSIGVGAGVPKFRGERALGIRPRAVDDAGLGANGRIAPVCGDDKQRAKMPTVRQRRADMHCAEGQI
jgi:hypothetical protein